MRSQTQTLYSEFIKPKLARTIIVDTSRGIQKMEMQSKSKIEIVVDLEKIGVELSTYSKSNVIGYVKFLGKVNAIIVKGNQVEVQETDIIFDSDK